MNTKINTKIEKIDTTTKEDRHTRAYLRNIEESSIYIEVLGQTLDIFFPDLVKRLDQLEYKRRGYSVDYFRS
jgi:hypothetical protein